MTNNRGQDFTLGDVWVGCLALLVFAAIAGWSWLAQAAVVVALVVTMIAAIYVSVDRLLDQWRE